MDQPTTSPRVRLSERALLQRVKKALAAKGAWLRKARGERTKRDLGRFFIIDAKQNTITATHQTLEELGRELKVLAGYETLADG